MVEIILHPILITFTLGMLTLIAVGSAIFMASVPKGGYLRPVRNIGHPSPSQENHNDESHNDSDHRNDSAQLTGAS